MEEKSYKRIIGSVDRNRMMFWFIYFLAVVFLGYLINISLGKNRIFILIMFFIIFLTPAQIELGSNDFAPALFTFLFSIVLEQSYSTRVLRPFVFSLPAGLIILPIVLFFKKKFFSSQDYLD